VQDVVADPARERSVADQPGPARLLLELGLVHAGAGDEKAHPAGAADDVRQRVERELKALLVDEPADEQHEPLVRRGEARAQLVEVGDRPQVARVDAVRRRRRRRRHGRACSASR
jgi:hypothetical protein